MKKLLNTLFVTTQGAYLAREGETVQVRVEKETRLQLPIHTLAGIVCFGQVSCSPFLLGLCAERGVGVSFLTEYGRFMAKMQGPVSGNVLLRRQQYRWADDEAKSVDLARSVLTGKIANSRTVLSGRRGIMATKPEAVIWKVRSRDCVFPWNNYRQPIPWTSCGASKEMPQDVILAFSTS
jgi:CRISPR-associated protein Cas1